MEFSDIYDLEQQMNDLRIQQVGLCNKLTPLCEEIISSLNNIRREDVKICFLHWIKTMLNAKSKAHLPQLHRKYHELWAELQKAKESQEKQDRGLIKKLQAEVDQADVHLADASFGLENILRELGQIYEAVHEASLHSDKDILEKVKHLPETTARLLLKGIPLELVDGDASNVPLTWIRAVLSKLEKLIGERKLFVISVLGIPS